MARCRHDDDIALVEVDRDAARAPMRRYTSSGNETQVELTLTILERRCARRRGISEEETQPGTRGRSCSGVSSVLLTSGLCFSDHGGMLVTRLPVPLDVVAAALEPVDELPVRVLGITQFRGLARCHDPRGVGHTKHGRPRELALAVVLVVPPLNRCSEGLDVHVVDATGFGAVQLHGLIGKGAVSHNSPSHWASPERSNCSAHDE